MRQTLSSFPKLQFFFPDFSPLLCEIWRIIRRRKCCCCCCQEIFLMTLFNSSANEGLSIFVSSKCCKKSRKKIILGKFFEQWKFDTDWLELTSWKKKEENSELWNFKLRTIRTQSLCSKNKNCNSEPNTKV